MRAHVMSNKSLTVEEGRLEIPDDRAVKHPFARIAAEPDTDVVIATVLAIGRAGEPTPDVSIISGGRGGEIKVGGRTITVGEHASSVI